MELKKEDLKSIEEKTKPLLKSTGKYILSQWHKIESIKYKNRRDSVSNVDVEAENKLRKGLYDIFPEAGFIVEEGKNSKKSQYNWAIDPIDGTKNYVSSLPMFFTQIALMKNNEPILGQVYNPVSDQFFSAVTGGGAFLNDNKISIVRRSDPKESIIDVDFGGDDNITDWKVNLLSKLIRLFYRVRMTGGFMYPYVATGAADAHVYLDKKTKIMDYMPGLIILRESGLQADFITLKNENRLLVVATNSLFEKLKQIIVG